MEMLITSSTDQPRLRFTFIIPLRVKHVYSVYSTTMMTTEIVWMPISLLMIMIIKMLHEHHGLDFYKKKPNYLGASYIS